MCIFLAYLFIFLIVSALVYEIYHYSFPHIHYKFLSLISEDARIIDMVHSKENFGKHRYIKTVVKFSDGFEYHTYETSVEQGIIHSKIYIDDNTKKRILTSAIKAHQKLLSKKQKRELINTN